MKLKSPGRCMAPVIGALALLNTDIALAQDGADDSLEEIIVVGSHIRCRTGTAANEARDRMRVNFFCRMQ